MADKNKTPGPRAGQDRKKKKYVHEEHNKAFPGDFKNFTESKELKDSRKTAKDKYEKDKQHPVKGKHAGFDRLVNSGKEEQKAFKKYRKNTAETRDKNKPSARSTDVEAVMLKKGGRAGYKGGGMSQRGLGRAFMKGGKV